jgi:hypothetical protein
LIGGYIYLRFFNPVIVTPDAMNIITTKPNRIQRRNLILVAKVLQNLSNGLLFGDKEVYMKVLNQYIQGMCISMLVDCVLDRTLWNDRSNSAHHLSSPRV